MSLKERLDFEEGKITASDFVMRTCCNCKYWNNLITHKLDFCHKCINNPRIPIKIKEGYSIEELYDYYSPLTIYKEALYT
ncbi:MAG: hypothetical protein OEV44_12120 [Spirochaetota bacterium]|nr:hypothetical protein [Spirochaetota bacterium]